MTVGIAVATLALGAVAASASGASAATAKVKPLKGTYHVTGTSTVKKTGSSLDLGPATLTIFLRNSGAFTGNLPLPPAQTSFKLGGVIPVTATVNFIPVGKVTGSVGFKKRLIVTSSAKQILRLSDVTTGGLPTPVGDSCQTSTPVSLSLTNPGKFDIGKGGTLTGTFTIPDFANCGLTTPVINQSVPGDGNTISLQLTHGHLGG